MGRPPIPPETWNAILDDLNAMKAPADIASIRGVSIAKVYEIRRNGQRQQVEGSGAE